MSRAKRLVAKIKTAKQTVTPANLQTLHKWLAIVYAVQGIALLVLSTTKTLPIVSSYLTIDPLATEAGNHPVLAVATRHLFDVNLAYIVAALLFVAAISHALVATRLRQNYEADLKKSINRARWIQYAVSGGLSLLLIALLSGVYELSTLLLIFALNVIMNLLGLAMEVHAQGKGKPSRLTCWVSLLAGSMPWVVLAIYLAGANLYGGSDVPAFVYYIYGSMLVLFGGLATITWLQFKKKGAWANYVYSERMYMLLNVVAISALTWQIFAGTLRP